LALLSRSSHFLCSRSGAPPLLPSFPTRRSSDLDIPSIHDHAIFVCINHRTWDELDVVDGHGRIAHADPIFCRFSRIRSEGFDTEDRKSTRLNSSHVSISYAVFCLKKKTRTQTTT